MHFSRDIFNRDIFISQIRVHQIRSKLLLGMIMKTVSPPLNRGNHRDLAKRNRLLKTCSLKNLPPRKETQFRRITGRNSPLLARASREIPRLRGRRSSRPSHGLFYHHDFKRKSLSINSAIFSHLSALRALAWPGSSVARPP